MSRVPIALLAGLFGFATYVIGVVTLADHVLTLHWAVQAVFFLLAGTLWAWPASRLMIWAAGKN